MSKKYFPEHGKTYKVRIDQHFHETTAKFSENFGWKCDKYPHILSKNIHPVMVSGEVVEVHE